MMIATAVEAGLTSAYISMGIAAVTGGDIGAAFASGFVGGFFRSIGGALGGFVGIVAGGALGAAVMGGDPVMGAITAGISAGVSATFADLPIPSSCQTLEQIWLWELAVSTASGALAGGVTAEIMGGDFLEGTAYGAASAAAGWAVSKVLLLDRLRSELLRIEQSGEIPDWLMGMDVAMHFNPLKPLQDLAGLFTTADEAQQLAEAWNIYGVGGETANLIGQVGPYSVLRKLTKGTRLAVHHIIEKRFAETLRVSEKDMLCVVVDRETHRLYTNAWRSEIPYRNLRNLFGFNTRTATLGDVYHAARQIYRDTPVLLNKVGIEP